MLNQTYIDNTNCFEQCETIGTYIHYRWDRKMEEPLQITIWRPPTNVSKPLACSGIIQLNILENEVRTEYSKRIFIVAVLTNA